MQNTNFSLNPKDLAILAVLEAQEAQWVDFDGSTRSPKECFLHYKDGRHFGDDIETALLTLEAGDGLGIMPTRNIYAVRFQAKDDLQAFSLIQSVITRAGGNPEIPPPITGTKDGDFIALFLFPFWVGDINYRNMVPDVQIPGHTEMVTLYLGNQSFVPFLGPMGSSNRHRAVVEDSRLQVLHPEAWAKAELLTKKMDEFLTVEGSYRRRLGQAKNHLKVILAGIQPLDDPWKVLEVAAADLVAGFILNPYDGLALLSKPLGKKATGQTFLEHLAHRLPASREFRAVSLRRLFDVAVDLIPPVGVAAFKRQEAKAKWASLLETLSNTPSLTTPAMISAERLRLAFCELTGVDPHHMNQTVFGTMLGKAIRAGKIHVGKDRFLHPTMGDHTIYVGIDEALMKQALYWQEERRNRHLHRNAV